MHPFPLKTPSSPMTSKNDLTLRFLVANLLNRRGRRRVMKYILACSSSAYRVAGKGKHPLFWLDFSVQRSSECDRKSCWSQVLAD